MPDDSREEDEWQEERRLRDLLRGRMKRARAVVASTPGLAETHARDWRKAAQFYTRSRITEAMVRQGVSAQTSGGPRNGRVARRFGRRGVSGSVFRIGSFLRYQEGRIDSGHPSRRKLIRDSASPRFLRRDPACGR